MSDISKISTVSTDTNSKKFLHFSFEMAETFIVSIIILFIIYTVVAMPEQVWGISMEPTFHTGERILVEKLTKHFNGFQRGDIVVLNPPNNSNDEYIKRVIGMPEDIVKIYDCKVYITENGKKYELEESYLAPDTCTEEGPQIKSGRSIKIPDNEYMVLGDNRGHSSDSRYFGFVTKNRIIGKVVFRFWPLNNIGWL